MRFLSLFILCLLPAAASAKTLLLLPIAGETNRTTDIGAIDRLFRDAMETRHGGTLVPVPPLAAPCGERFCALEAAKAAGVDEVVYSSFYKLGERWVFSATIVNADGTGIFNQRLTATSVEDMEAVTLRMADALGTRRSVEQVASLDNITGREQEQEPERRRSLYNGGVALGYLFPVGSSFSYVDEDESFMGQPERHSYDQMIRMIWMNTWEFRNDLALGADVTWSFPYAIGADVNLRRHFGRGDISPFVGGGLGLHYVKADEDDFASDTKRNSGPAVNVQGGAVLFRTYDVNVMLRGQYQVIFNSDVDHGPAIDVGVSFRNKDGNRGRGGGDEMGFWGYAGVVVGTLLLLGVLAN